VSNLGTYEAIVGRSTISELEELAKRLAGKRIVTINSTRVGGGVAEILNRMIPLLHELKLDVRWEVLEGTDAFYKVTKKVHNALHGQPEQFTKDMFELLMENGRKNAKRLALDADVVFVHDPQPLPLIEARGRQTNSHWIWRCHIDVSRPRPAVWDVLQPLILQYDAAVYSTPSFAQRMQMRQLLIAPSIDPLSDKNRELQSEEISQVLDRLSVPRDLPIVTQVSRFDHLKDPLGVVDAFRRVRRSVKCRLVLAGGPASDDPEAEEVLALVREAAKDSSDIHLLMLPPNSDLEINALQRASAVVVQKSIREGFALTVAEALWKGRPVVASAVGGIPLQVKHHYSGLLVHSVEGAAFAIKQLLNNPDYAGRLGENGREHVRQNFLLTRHLMDYLLMFLSLEHKTDTIYLNGGS